MAVRLARVKADRRIGASRRLGASVPGAPLGRQKAWSHATGGPGPGGPDPPVGGVAQSP